MILIGLTGSIASGKSTVAGWLVESGIAVHDSDSTVHILLGPDGLATPKIIERFGNHILAINGSVDREKLGDHVFNNPGDRQILERLIHPLVRQDRDKFIQAHLKQGTEIVVLDVPLLFETGVDALCNRIIVVHASFETIRGRALERPGMTEDKLNGILSNQMSVEEKCQRADLALNTDLDPLITRKNLFSWLNNFYPDLDLS